jgi:predicted DNA-binding antitoxin AbrB/MazE fold protein
MTIQIDAVYQDGVLRPTQPIELQDGSEVQIVIHTASNTAEQLANGIGDGPEHDEVDRQGISSFEAYLQSMPNAGQDADFSRIEGSIRDTGLAN